MPKRRSEPYKHQTFNLSLKVIEKLEEISKFEGLTKGQMVEFLINNYDLGISPAEKLGELNKERKQYLNKINEIDNKEEELQRQMKNFEEWKKEKEKKKPEAVNILVRKILNEEISEAERISKVWSRITGVPATQLLFEAQDKVKSGV